MRSIEGSGGARRRPGEVGRRRAEARVEERSIMTVRKRVCWSGVDRTGHQVDLRLF